MTIQANDAVPAVKIKIIAGGDISNINTKDLFGTGKSILFGLPGAFTPTCSKFHLPGFIAKAGSIRDRGIDRIVCMSVNDAFVMEAWSKEQKAEQIIMIADGEAEFSKALGLDIDKPGMGQRCKRFAAIINNGAVTQIFIEKPGEFKVSSAENILLNL